MKGFLKDSSRFCLDDMVTPVFDRDEVVKRALSQVGSDFGGYHFFKNNCEHFTYWCATGKKSSRQVFFMNDDQDIVGKAIDRAFEPLVRLGGEIDKLFGWD